MNIDNLTGLPIVSAGYFFRVIEVKERDNWGCSTLDFHVQLRKKFLFGLLSWLVNSQSAAPDHKERDEKFSKSRIKAAAIALWTVHSREILGRARAKKLVGDYPPKKLQ